MTCENVYQSETCCEFSELWTTPCHSLTVPQAQIGVRPIASSTAAAAATMARPTRSVARSVRRVMRRAA